MNINKTEIESSTKGDKQYELENLLNESSSDDENGNKKSDEENSDDGSDQGVDADVGLNELDDWAENDDDDLEAQNADLL